MNKSIYLSKFVQVRRRFVSSRNRNNITIHNAMQDVLNGEDNIYYDVFSATKYTTLQQ